VHNSPDIIIREKAKVINFHLEKARGTDLESSISGFRVFHVHVFPEWESFFVGYFLANKIFIWSTFSWPNTIYTEPSLGKFNNLVSDGSVLPY
jgi:hypothetical protein